MSEWISVEDRLPVFVGYVTLVIASTDVLGGWVEQANGCAFWRLGPGEARRVFNVTHWMPLPEPPK